jgi:hypothetical protein
MLVRRQVVPIRGQPLASIAFSQRSRTYLGLFFVEVILLWARLHEEVKNNKVSLVDPQWEQEVIRAGLTFRRNDGILTPTTCLHFRH